MLFSRFHQRLSVGTKLTLANTLLVALLFAGFVTAITTAFTQAIEEHSRGELKQQTTVMADMIESAVKNLHDRVAAVGATFNKSLKGRVELTAAQMEIHGRVTPVLTLDGKPLNQNFALVDGFGENIGGVATVFARTGDDFVRITTSLKNEKGERAIGTLLDRSHPGYKAILAGERYMGPATLFGRHYMTQYDPILDAAGRTVGVSFVGLDCTDFIADIKKSIRDIKIGDSGYFFVLDAKPGKSRGEVIVHPSKEGVNLINAKDAHGNLFIKDMLDRRNGIADYDWLNAERGETSPRAKIAAYRTIDGLNWLVAGGGYVDEFSAKAIRVRDRFLALAALLLAVASAVSYFLVRKLVIQPLAAAQAAAEAMASGDLTVRIESRSADEVGRLTAAINQVGIGLTEVVVAVRENSESVATASAQIAQSNQDLSARTEHQASSLEETSSAMQQLGATVQEHASFAVRANQRAVDASRIAATGGQMMGEVALTMQEINGASHRISDITSIIDGLAFQTNILALNAAVESARAGDAGRGFAVVASEVRNLAARSAEAAKEIRTLIAESVSRVEAGTELVERTSDTMRELVATIGDVTQVMADISAASQDQAVGVNEVGVALVQMDRNTQSNSGLVDEMAAAAVGLRNQAQSLVQVVSMFKIARFHAAE